MKLDNERFSFSKNKGISTKNVGMLQKNIVIVVKTTIEIIIILI